MPSISRQEWRTLQNNRMSMRLYDIIKSADDKIWRALEKEGITIGNVNRYLLIYDKVKEKLEEGAKKLDAYEMVGSEVYMSADNVRRIFAKLNRIIT